MQFKHPEILYALFALAIPVFVHLFHLQRFVPTEFTNVKFLKKIQLQTRKSSQLKKWLVLLTRLGIFAALIIAFAQPYKAKKTASKQWLTSLYIDNSVSMQAQGEKGSLFKRSIQELIENTPQNGIYNLLTNNEIYTELTKKALDLRLHEINYSVHTEDYKSILLKQKEIASKHPEKYNKLVLISDFQHFNPEVMQDSSLTGSTAFSFVALQPEKNFNLRIDSLYFETGKQDKKHLYVQLGNQGAEKRQINLSIVKNKITLAKKNLEIPANGTLVTPVQLPDEATGDLEVKIHENDAYLFDNTRYIHIEKPRKISVLSIGEDLAFLRKIYTPDSFHYNRRTIASLNYELLERQHLILLHSSKPVPGILTDKLREFVQKGGSLVFIPHKDNTVAALNQIAGNWEIGRMEEKVQNPLKITKIHYDNPVFQGVFEKRITHFQYPEVNLYFKAGFLHEQPVLSFENQMSFITGFHKAKGRIYWVSAPLDKNSGNFTASPLVVPVFYNIALQSTPQNRLYYLLGKPNTIAVKLKARKDEVLHLQGGGESFIPLQDILREKVLLYTENQPVTAGFYHIYNTDKPISSVAYNYAKEESRLPDRTNVLNSLSKPFSSVKTALQQIANAQHVDSLFRYFILLALLFLFLEIFFLKYF